MTKTGFGPRKVYAPVLEASQQLRSCPDLPVREPQRAFVPGHRQQVPAGRATGPGEPLEMLLVRGTSPGLALFVPSVSPKVGNPFICS